MLDTDWRECIVRSINKHFVSELTVTTFLQNQSFMPPTDIEWVSIRSSRYVGQQNGNSWIFDFDINLLVCCPIGNNIYNDDRLVGVVSSVLTKGIPFLDLDDNFLGCFQLVGNITSSKFGQIASDIKLSQSTVEAHLRCEMDNSNV